MATATYIDELRITAKAVGFDSLESAVVRVSGALGAIFAGAAGVAVLAARDFEQGMGQIATLIPGQTERLDDLRGTVHDLASEFGVTDKAGLQGAVYETISAFGDSVETVDRMKVALMGAKAGGTDAASALALLSATTKGYGDTSADALGKASDLAFLTVKLGQTDFPQLARSIGQVVPIAADLKVSQEELFGVMATATGVTGNASQVSTQLRSALAGLMRPTETMAGLYEDLGVKGGHALIAQHGLQGALDLVREHSTAAEVPMAKYFESVEAVGLVSNLTSTSSERLSSNILAMNGAAGATEEAFNAATGGINAAQMQLDSDGRLTSTGRWSRAGRAILGLGTNVGAAALGAAEFGGAIASRAATDRDHDRCDGRVSGRRRPSCGRRSRARSESRLPRSWRSARRSTGCQRRSEIRRRPSKS